MFMMTLKKHNFQRGCWHERKNGVVENVAKCSNAGVKRCLSLASAFAWLHHHLRRFSPFPIRDSILWLCENVNRMMRKADVGIVALEKNPKYKYSTNQKKQCESP